MTVLSSMYIDGSDICTVLRHTWADCTRQDDTRMHYDYLAFAASTCINIFW